MVSLWRVLRLGRNSQKVHAAVTPCTTSNTSLRLPVEILLLILHSVDSKSSLLAWCCLCRTLRDEAEQLLYREVSVFRAPQIRSFYRALKAAPRRAALVRTLDVRDNGSVNPVIPILNDMLPEFKNLTHLLLDLSASYKNPLLYHTVLATLNKCSFALESFRPRCVNSDPMLLAFLTRQPGIIYLDAPIVVDTPPRTPLPLTALPRLKYLGTGYDFFPAVIRADQITHLSIVELPGLEHGLRKVLESVGHQLVSLWCEQMYRGNGGHPVCPPTIAFKVAALPRLRFLEVTDIMDAGFGSIFMPDSDTFTYMARSDIILDTLVWRLEWRMDGVPARERDRIGYVAQVAKPLLEACPSLRQVFYGEPNSSTNKYISCSRLMLSDNGELDVQPKMETDLPTWRETLEQQ